MAKEDLGTKRLCPNCGTKYYDLNKRPPVCPKCGTVFEMTTTRTRSVETVAEPEKPAEKEVTKRAPEVISLEEADIEATGEAKASEDEEDNDTEAADDEDDTFLEREEDEEDDVTGIVGEVDKEDT